VNAHLETVLRALENARGDDLIRAKNAFRGFTAKQMNAPWGSFNRTPTQFLASYASHDAKIDAAIAWVKEHAK